MLVGNMDLVTIVHDWMQQPVANGAQVSLPYNMTEFHGIKATDNSRSYIPGQELQCQDTYK